MYGLAPWTLLIAVVIATRRRCAHGVVDTTHGIIVITFEAGGHWVVLILRIHGRGHAVSKVGTDARGVTGQMRSQLYLDVTVDR